MKPNLAEKIGRSAAMRRLQEQLARRQKQRRNEQRGPTRARFRLGMRRRHPEVEVAQMLQSSAVGFPLVPIATAAGMTEVPEEGVGTSKRRAFILGVLAAAAILAGLGMGVAFFR